MSLSGRGQWAFLVNRNDVESQVRDVFPEWKRLFGSSILNG